MADRSTLFFEKTVKAPVSEVYRAFTNATALREWMCDTATLDLKTGGHIYLAWNNGFYCAGEFLAVKQNEEVVFSSHGRKEPGLTTITIKLLPRKNSTVVQVTHAGMKPVWKWRKHLPNMQHWWRSALRNLAAVLENGADLRIIERPMLGIFVDSFDKAVAQKLGVPVTEGVRLGGVVDGMGAKACGLQKDDVIITMAGKPVSGFASVGVALGHHKAGEKVEIVYYRGAAKKTVFMPLTARPIPKIPSTPAAFSQAVKKVDDADYAALEKMVKNLTEKLASKKPSPKEWSVNEIIAHLIEVERNWHDYINQLQFSQEQVSDGYGDNSHARILADVSAYPTLKDLLKEFKRSQLITVTFLKNLPKEFLAHKGSYWKLSFAMLQPSTHTQEHLNQIKDTITQVKGKKNK